MHTMSDEQLPNEAIADDDHSTDILTNPDNDSCTSALYVLIRVHAKLYMAPSRSGKRSRTQVINQEQGSLLAVHNRMRKLSQDQ